MLLLLYSTHLVSVVVVDCRIVSLRSRIHIRLVVSAESAAMSEPSAMVAKPSAVTESASAPTIA